LREKETDEEGERERERGYETSSFEF